MSDGTQRRLRPPPPSAEQGTDQRRHILHAVAAFRQNEMMPLSIMRLTLGDVVESTRMLVLLSSGWTRPWVSTRKVRCLIPNSRDNADDQITKFANVLQSVAQLEQALFEEIVALF